MKRQKFDIEELEKLVVKKKKDLEKMQKHQRGELGGEDKTENTKDDSEEFYVDDSFMYSSEIEYVLTQNSSTKTTPD